MAKSAKESATESTGTISAETAKTAKSFLERIESVQADIDKIKADAAEECAPLYDDIASIKREAHDAGIPRREFNSLISERKLLKKAEALRASLSEDQQHNFDQMKLALGDLAETELGRAARRRAGDTTAAEALH